MEPVLITLSVQPPRARSGEQPASLPAVAGAQVGAAEQGPGEDHERVPTSVEVEHLDQLLQQHQQHLAFSVDETSGRSVMKVIDTESGEVIRQMPGESWLKLARELAQSGSGLLRDQA